MIVCYSTLSETDGAISILHKLKRVYIVYLKISEAFVRKCFLEILPFHNSKNILTLPKPIAEQPLA